MDLLLAGMGSGAHADAVRLVWQALLPSEPSQGPDLTHLQGDENTLHTGFVVMLPLSFVVFVDGSSLFCHGRFKAHTQKIL